MAINKENFIRRKVWKKGVSIVWDKREADYLLCISTENSLHIKGIYNLTEEDMLADDWEEVKNDTQV